MALDIVPEPLEEERAVLERAVVDAGIQVDAAPEAYTRSWWRTAVSEAVDRQPQPRRPQPRQPQPRRPQPPR